MSNSAKLQGIKTIYFIGPEDRSIGVVKIGQTAKDAGKRLSAIQTGHPHKLEVYGSVRDDGRYEEALHLLFKPLRLHGEWFRLEGSLQRLIDCLCCSRGASPEWDSVEFWGAVFDSVKPEKDCRTHDLPSLSYLTPKVSIFCSIWEIGQ